MKKLMFFTVLVLMCLVNNVAFSQQYTSRVVYYNKTMHLQVYEILSEDSIPHYNICKEKFFEYGPITLGMLDRETVIEICKKSLELYKIKEIGKTIKINETLSVTYIESLLLNHWFVIQINNTNGNICFNINKRTAKDILKMLSN